MKKAYILSTCDTCKRILKEVGWTEEVQDIKKENIEGKTLDMLAEKSAGYENVFNKRARKFKDPILKESIKKDQDYRKLILEEYTFLKRPVFIYDEEVFVGNSKATVQLLKEFLKKKS